VLWLIAAPTSALILISASAALWAVLGRSKCAAWLAAVAACGLAIGAFTPIGVALLAQLEYRLAFSPPDSQAAPDGIIVQASVGDVDAVQALSQDYPKARVIFIGFEWDVRKTFARRGGDLTRVVEIPPSPTTSEDALHSAALLKPKPRERWLLVTEAFHMPRAVGCFRVAGFQVEPYPVASRLGREGVDRSHRLSADGQALLAGEVRLSVPKLANGAH
jgi:uncharacterized SAM-binding protein YcdF (DUF218 family)